jgi:cell division protein FtsW (lipid II flippase)
LDGASFLDIVSRASTIISVLLTIILICIIPRSLIEIKKLFYFILIGSSLVGIYLIFFGNETFSKGYESFTTVDNFTIFYDHDFAIQLSLSLIFSWLLFYNNSNYNKIIIFILNLILLLCISTTLSRSAFAGIFFAVFSLFAFFIFQFKPLYFFKIGLILIFVFLLVKLFYQNDIFSKEYTQILLDRIESSTTSSGNERIEILWPRAISYIFSNPIFGAGMGGGSKIGVAHNAILEMGVEGGLFGILFYFISIYYMIAFAFKLHNLFIKAWVFAIIVFIITISQTNPITFYSFHYAFAVGLICWLEINTNLINNYKNTESK